MSRFGWTEVSLIICLCGIMVIAGVLGCGPAPETYQSVSVPTAMPSNAKHLGQFHRNLYVVENGQDTIYLYGQEIVVIREEDCGAR